MKKYSTTLAIALLFSPFVLHAGTSGYFIDKNVNLIPHDPNGNKRVVLITIDDGPSKYGKEMVRILNMHNAKAIFFINGIHDKGNKGNIAFQFKDGFAIGNHTWSHINLKKEKKENKIKKEIDDTNTLIQKETGQMPRFFRAPYGMTTPYAKDLIKNEGMISMNWSGSALDWEKDAKDKTKFINNVTSTLHPGEIILLHEHEWTTKYLDDLLKIIEAQGYTFLDPALITN